MRLARFICAFLTLFYTENLERSSRQTELLVAIEVRNIFPSRINGHSA